MALFFIFKRYNVKVRFPMKGHKWWHQARTNFYLGGGGANLQVQEPTATKLTNGRPSYSATHPDQTHVMLMVIENKMALCTLINLNLHEIGLL